MVILLMLAVIRTGNLGLLWHLHSQEIRNRPGIELENYVFVGFSSRKSAEERLSRYSDTGGRPFAVASYFDFIHPAVYLISNTGGAVFADLGRLSIFVRPGETRVAFHPEDVVERTWKETTQAFYFGEAPLSPLFKSFARVMIARSKAGPEISYVIEPLEKMKHLRWSYLIYFYIPLIIIIWLSTVYGRGFWVAFLYYLGLFLFFDFKQALATVPFIWFLSFINVELSSGAALVISLMVLCVSIGLAFSGFVHWGKLEKGSWAKPLAVLFILLPVFLRL